MKNGEFNFQLLMKPEKFFKQNKMLQDGTVTLMTFHIHQRTQKNLHYTIKEGPEQQRNDLTLKELLRTVTGTKDDVSNTSKLLWHMW